jgi:hypothetical protein
MRTGVVTICDLTSARDVTGSYPDGVQVMTNRSVGERLCRSEEMEARDNKKTPCWCGNRPGMGLIMRLW